MAEGNGVKVTVQGRPSKLEGRAQIAFDVVRPDDRVMVEKRDVLQEQAQRRETTDGHPTFGDSLA